MVIPIKSDEEMIKLFDAIVSQIVDARIYYRLLCDLMAARKKDYKPFTQAPTFWYLAFNAVMDAYMVRLCRVYDTHSKALNIVNLLDTIKANPHIFSEDNFKKRLSDNPHVDTLWDSSRIPDTVQLEKDIESVNKKNPVVIKLMIWRHNMVAHIGAGSVLDNNKVLVDNPLTEKEIEKLLEQSMDIYNRYSNMYRAGTWVPNIIGHDDYKTVLKFMNLGLEKWDEDIKKQTEEITRRIKEKAQDSQGESVST
jgi:predicted MPP superfamily phosphohydrolase